MAKIDLVAQQIVRDSSGLTPNYSTPAQTDLRIPNNDGRMFLHVKNSNAATRTVTVTTPGEIAGLAISDLVATVPLTSGDKMIGPFPPGVFNQTDGSVYVDLESTAGITLALLRL